jgi:hypothetical protein
MSAIQLEFNIDSSSEEDYRFSCMQKQINEMNDSMGKVRRGVFREVGELKKIVLGLREENETLKRKLGEKTEWKYCQNNCLFDI